jgi:hypothetical protein
MLHNYKRYLSLLLLAANFSHAATVSFNSGGAATYKPAVASIAALPATGNVAGDARVVLSPIGFYGWDGASWNALGGGGGGAVTSIFGRAGVVVAVAGDYTASQVTNVPAGGIAAVTAQAAINELDSEKQNLLVNSAGLAAALSDETGTGLAVFGTSPALLGNPTAPTQAALDNSTKIATTAYADSAVSAAVASKLSDTDGLYDLKNTGDATKKQHWALGGQTTGTTSTFAPLNTQNQTYNIQPNVDASANILTQNATSGQVFIGSNTSIAASNAGIQYSDASTANRAQIKLHSYVNAASVAGVSTLTSKSGTVGVNNSIAINQDYSKWTAQAGATTVGSAPISGTFAFKSAGTINALTVPTGFHIDTTNLAGTLGIKLSLDSEGILTLPAYGVGVAQFDASGNMSSSALSASSIVNVPAGNISAVTVQAAIDELDSEKQALLVNSAGLAAALSDETGTAFAVFSDSPALTGNPTAPTQAALDNSTKIATTAYADAAVAAAAPTGANYAVAGFDATGDLYSIPNTFHTDYNGLYTTVQIPVAGTLTGLNLSTAAGVAPGTVEGIVINNQTESTLNTTLIDMNNAAPIGDDFSGLRLFNSGASVDGLIMQSVGNSGNFGSNMRLMEATNSGSGAGGILYNIANSGNMSAQFVGLQVSDSGTHTANSQIANFNKQGDTTGDANGVGIGLDGDVTGNATSLTVGANGNNIGGGYIGANIYSSNIVTGDSTMMYLSENGSADDKTGLSINISGAATSSVTGANINVSGATFAGQKTALDVQGGVFRASSDIDTGVFTPASFFNNNSLGGQLIVASGDPLVATPGFGNNLGIVIGFADDATADNFIGVGNSLGFSINGFVNQVIGTAGKTFDTINYMLAGGSNPSGDGTIVNLNMFRTAGLINAGGNLAVTNMRGFYVDPAFDGSVASTNKWGFINASSSNNWMKGSLVLGGTTGALTGAFVLDVLGDSNLDGDLTVTGAADLGNGSVAVTQAANDNTTKIATTAYVDAAVGAGGVVSSVFGRTGAVVATNGDYTASQVTNVPAGSIAAVTVQAALNELDSEKQSLLVNSAGLAAAISDETGTGVAVFSISPALTGSPTAPTQAALDNSTKIATTAYADAAASAAAAASIVQTILNGDTTHASSSDALFDALALKQDLLVNSAGLAAALSDETGTGLAVFGTSPALLGTPTAPTAAFGTSTTQLATTAFVQAAIATSVVNGGNAAYTILAADGHVRSGTALTANRTYTLPACAANIGEKHVVKNLPSQSFNIILAANGADVIDGVASKTLLPGDSVPVICAVSGVWDIQ